MIFRERDGNYPQVDNTRNTEIARLLYGVIIISTMPSRKLLEGLLEKPDYHGIHTYYLLATLRLLEEGMPASKIGEHLAPIIEKFLDKEEAGAEIRGLPKLGGKLFSPQMASESVETKAFYIIGAFPGMEYRRYGLASLPNLLLPPVETAALMVALIEEIVRSPLIPEGVNVFYQQLTVEGRLTDEAKLISLASLASTNFPFDWRKYDQLPSSQLLGAMIPIAYDGGGVDKFSYVDHIKHWANKLRVPDCRRHYYLLVRRWFCLYI